MRGEARTQKTTAGFQGRQQRMSREEQAGRCKKRAGLSGKGWTSTSTRRPTQETAPQGEGILRGSREEIGVAEKDFSEARDAGSVLREMTYQKQVPSNKPSTQTRAEQRHSYSAKDSSPIPGSHTRMCSSKTGQETKKEAALGAETQTPTQGWRWLPGMWAPERKSVTSSWGKVRTEEMHTI